MLPRNIVLFVLNGTNNQKKKKKKISRQQTVPSVFCLGVRRHCLEKGTDHMLKGEDINHLLRTSKMKCEGKHETGKRSF